MKKILVLDSITFLTNLNTIASINYSKFKIFIFCDLINLFKLKYYIYKYNIKIDKIIIKYTNFYNANNIDWYINKLNKLYKNNKNKILLTTYKNLEFYKKLKSNNNIAFISPTCLTNLLTEEI